MAFGSKEPTVPMTLYTDLLSKYHALVETVAKMRGQGFTAQGEIKVIPPKPPAEERAVKRAHDDFTVELASHLKSIPGVTEAQAKAEADRIRSSFDQPFPTG